MAGSMPTGNSGPSGRAPEARLAELLGQPPCRFCGCPVSAAEREAGAFLGDTIRCQECFRASVLTMPQARRLFAPVLRWVRAQGVSLPRSGPRIMLCNEAHLSRIRGGAGWRGELGATWYARSPNGPPAGVVLLWGLPETIFQGVAVYEVTRYWFRLRETPHLPDWFKTGFSQLLLQRHGRHRLLRRLGRAARLAEAVEPWVRKSEGSSLRRVRELVDRQGFKQVLAGINDPALREKWGGWDLPGDTGKAPPGG